MVFLLGSKNHPVVNGIFTGELFFWGVKIPHDTGIGRNATGYHQLKVQILSSLGLLPIRY